jgi:NADH-quinone oxidoreductase subunit C
VPKTTDKPADTGAGELANKEAAKPVAGAEAAPAPVAKAEPGAPAPTDSRPAKTDGDGA